MRAIAPVLILLSLASCKEKPSLTPEARGAQFFMTAADKLGALVVSDMKTSKPTWYKQYMEDTRSKEDAALARDIARRWLKECADLFALTEAQEAALKSGRFADAENREKIKKAAAKFGPDRPAPDAYRIALAKVDSGEWGRGLELEFVARLLQYQPTKR